MFHRILIPTDFSTASEWVFEDAVRIASASDAEVIILHVRMTWASHPDELRFPADPSLYEYAEKLELERLRDRVRRVSASVTTRLIVRLAPDPGNEICRTAKSENVDLIVIATHARHHVAHLLVGSTTMSVLKDPPAPVLAIRYGIRKRSSMNRVVVPVHLQQTSHSALALAAREHGVRFQRGSALNDVKVARGERGVITLGLRLQHERERLIRRLHAEQTRLGDCRRHALDL